MGGLLCKDGKTCRFSLAFKMEKGWEGLGVGWGMSLGLGEKKDYRAPRCQVRGGAGQTSFPEVWLVSEH